MKTTSTTVILVALAAILIATSAIASDRVIAWDRTWKDIDAQTGKEISGGSDKQRIVLKDIPGNADIEKIVRQQLYGTEKKPGAIRKLQKSTEEIEAQSKAAADSAAAAAKATQILGESVKNLSEASISNTHAITEITKTLKGVSGQIINNTLVTVVILGLLILGLAALIFFVVVKAVQQNTAQIRILSAQISPTKPTPPVTP